MATNRIADLTVDELRLLLREEMRDLIRETVQEVLGELIESDDSDTDFEFKPEILQQLRTFLREQPDGEPIDDLIREFGLDD